MTRRRQLVVASARMLTFCFLILAGRTLVSAQSTDHAVLLHWNDFHGQVLPLNAKEKLRGGIRALADGIGQVRQNVGADRVLVLDAGDWFQGTPEGVIGNGRLVIDLFNALRVDVSQVGNHDFDLGEQNLQDLVQNCQFPVLGANVVDAEGRTRSYLRPFVIKACGGIRFGIIGLLTPETPHIVRHEIGQGLRVDDAKEVCRRLVPLVLASGAECIVVLSHLGFDAERALASAVPGLHLIVGGHSHTAVDPAWRESTNGTVVVQAGHKGEWLGRIDVRRAAPSGFEFTTRLTALDGRLAELTSTAGVEVERVLKQYGEDLSRLAREMSEEVGSAAVDLLPPARGVPFPRSSLLGSWLCQSLADAAGTAIAIHNVGGIRAPLLAGPITRRELLEISPFGNQVTRCSLRGADLEDLFRRMLERSFTIDPNGERTNNGQWLETWGLEVRWKTVGAGITLDSLRVNGEPLESDRIYEFATNDYLSNGGDGWGDLFARHAVPRSTGVEVYAATVQTALKSQAMNESIAPSPTANYQQVGTPWQRCLGVVGMGAILLLAVLLSRDRKHFPIRTVVWGLALQFTIAFFILRTAAGKQLFVWISDFFQRLMGFAGEGNAMVFGHLADKSKGFIFFTQVTGTIILVSTLAAMLYHMRVMQVIVYAIARLMQLTMRASGAESLSTAANIFLGQTEAPLTVRPYLATMTQSEILAMMTGGMATVAGGVLAAYVGFGIDAGHLLTASVMSAPATLMIAKIVLPETEIAKTAGRTPFDIARTDANLFDAMCRGASEGMKLSLNVMAMLIAVTAVVALVNYLIGFPQAWFGWQPVTLQQLLGWLFAPVAWLLGIEWREADEVGGLLGTRMVLNEFFAYIELGTLKETLLPRTTVLATYALCGFANFASIAIQIGGISSLEEGIRPQLARLGLLSMLGGTLACLMTAVVVGVFV
ncbi:MAG: nucleoside transporter C-terminal domain-containing protein [Planctomycetota bacterium]